MDDQEIKQIIKGITDALEATSVHQSYMNDLIEKHEHTLYGNGKEGLTTIVDRVERYVEEARDIYKKIITALVIALIFGLIILVAQAGLLK